MVRLASDLARVEVHRSTLRRDAAALPRAVTALKGVHLIPLSDRVVTKAMSVGDSGLRSLDALHLSSAMLLKPRLTHFVVYDKRLYDAAQAEGLHPVRPGA
ncbi:type II toxin-antitoxin system VapC family toxin [Streptomyces jeddahensis]|uniref:Ribonuclease VapC47 n=1 Tax=Streptomyces jeddahensis TaxID=1716141 RepID=A0A177HW99_9ACTN|nr:type II toxin-antitoxin system VapC family toxin [Streptomyces jeddahensis]OAH15222.1 ribonuclease VapC47 [Streptomyces jeddahensis]